MPPRYPSPPRGQRSSYHLGPDPYEGRRRSRSRGGYEEPAEIHIYNNQYQDAHQDARDQSLPSPPMYGRGRSPARGYYEQPAYVYPAPVMGPPYSSHSRSRERGDDEYWRRKYIDDYRRAEKEKEEEKQKAIEDYEREQAKEKKDEKERQAEAVRKHEQDKKDEEEKQKKAWEEYEAKRKEKEQKEKEKKDKEDEEYRERLRKHLATLGYTQNQIDVIVANEKKKQGEGNGLIRTPSGQQQLVLAQKSLVYPKIKREYISLETLKFYDLKWKYDETDSDFIVILQEMSDRETDVLFAHTARLREKGKGTMLAIEDMGKGKKPQYMMVRKRSKSRGKSPSGAERLAEAVLRGG